MLETVVNVLQMYPATLYFALLSIVFQIGWALIWLMGVASIFNSMDRQNPPPTDGQRAGAYFGLLISFYWTSQVIKNIVHVTVAGTFASWVGSLLLSLARAPF